MNGIVNTSGEDEIKREKKENREKKITRRREEKINDGKLKFIYIYI